MIMYNLLIPLFNDIYKCSYKKKQFCAHTSCHTIDNSTRENAGKKQKNIVLVTQVLFRQKGTEAPPSLQEWGGAQTKRQFSTIKVGGAFLRGQSYSLPKCVWSDDFIYYNQGIL